METQWILTVFLKTSSVFLCPISTRYSIKYDQEYLLQWIQPSTSLLDYRVRVRIWSILRIHHRDRSHILSWFLPSEDPLVHLKRNRFNTHMTHTTWTELSATCRLKNLRYHLPSERYSYLSFSWVYWFGSHLRIKQSIDMLAVHYSEIFLWKGASTTLNTTTESPLVWSKTCRTSSVVGAPSGRHSRLDPKLAVLYSLDDFILLPHD